MKKGNADCPEIGTLNLLIEGGVTVNEPLVPGKCLL